MGGPLSPFSKDTDERLSIMHERTHTSMLKSGVCIHMYICICMYICVYVCVSECWRVCVLERSYCIIVRLYMYIPIL